MEPCRSDAIGRFGRAAARIWTRSGSGETDKGNHTTNRLSVLTVRRYHIPRVDGGV
jgi:hypothetical protein